MNRNSLFGCLCLLIIPFFFTSPVFALGTRVTAELGYGGFTVPGRWTPLRIKLDHPVNQGRIEVIRCNRTDNATLCETFSANTPRVECPVLMNEELKSITVRMISGSQVLGENRLHLNGKQFPGHLFLTVNIPAKIQNAIEGILQPQEPVLAVPVHITELPFSLFGYDSVSGIVMADPGPVLKPAQVSAFKAWLSSGGCAVIYGTPPNAESIVQLLKLRFDQGLPEKSAIKRVALGLGKLVLIPENFRDALLGDSPSGWQKLIGLLPYRHSTRLTLTRCFPPREFAPRPFDLRIELLAILGSWMAVLLGVLFLQKKYLVTISLCSVLMGALAFPLSGHLAGEWHRGYDIRCLAVNLPESAGMVIQGEIAAVKNSRWSIASSPWGVQIDWGEAETGSLKPESDSLPEWRHLGPRVFSTLLRHSTGSFDCIGWLPGGIFWPKFFQEAAAGQEILVYRPTGQIYRITEKQYPRWLGSLNRPMRTEFSPGKDLVPLSRFPLWLNDKADWLNRLSSAAPPQTLWIIGHRTTSGGFLQIQKSNRMEFIWVSPLPNVSLK